METFQLDDEAILNNTRVAIVKQDEVNRMSGRGSPPPNCVICLDVCQNKSFTDTCLHQFCFTCLLTWSKVKAECPLCKQIFRSIIHNVQPNQQYDEYMVPPAVIAPEENIFDRIDIDNNIDLADGRITNRRFRYRTTLTFPRGDSLMAIQQLLLESYRVLHLPELSPPPHRRPNSFRRTVYRHNLWARPLPDFTGRFRECSPDYYRLNSAQMHRLVPWVHREMNYLLNYNMRHITHVTTKLLELLPEHPLTSDQFELALRCYLGYQTEHFIHELHVFASTPYDMPGYDRHVQYTTRSRAAARLPDVACELDSGSDSDVVLLEPQPGPSAPARHSDDDADVMLVGYLRPPRDRTPEVVDLVASDSDVVLHEPADDPDPERKLVKLTLKRVRPESSPGASWTVRHSSDDDAPVAWTVQHSSDDDAPVAPRIKRRKRTKRRRRRVSSEDSDPSYCPPSTPPLPVHRAVSAPTSPALPIHLSAPASPDPPAAASASLPASPAPPIFLSAPASPDPSTEFMEHNLLNLMTDAILAPDSKVLSYRAGGREAPCTPTSAGGFGSDSDSDDNLPLNRYNFS